MLHVVSLAQAVAALLFAFGLWFWLERAKSSASKVRTAVTRPSVSRSARKTAGETTAGGEREAPSVARPPSDGGETIHSFVGRRVEVHSLTNRPDLNGQTGTATSLDEETGRYAVKLESGASFKLKPVNLWLVTGNAMPATKTTPQTSKAVQRKIKLKEAALPSETMAFGGSPSEQQELLEELGELSPADRAALKSAWSELPTQELLHEPTEMEMELNLSTYRKELTALLHKAAYEELQSQEEEQILVKRISELRELVSLTTELLEMEKTQVKPFPIVTT